MTIPRTISREQAEDMNQAHAEGLHAEVPREGCPDCEGRELREYPTRAQLAETTPNPIEQRALTLAVTCVEQRVETLRADWRSMSERQRALTPGLEQQIADEKQALAWLEQRRSEAYQPISARSGRGHDL